MSKNTNRTKEERQIETNSIIKSLNDLKINTGYPEERELYKCIQSYVNRHPFPRYQPKNKKRIGSR